MRGFAAKEIAFDVDSEAVHRRAELLFSSCLFLASVFGNCGDCSTALSSVSTEKSELLGNQVYQRSHMFIVRMAEVETWSRFR